MAARQVGNKLFVAKLPWTACKNSLTEHFSQYGKVTSSKVIFNLRTGLSKKYGFVFFTDRSSCEKAINDEHVIDGQKVAIEVMSSTDRRRQGNRTAELSDSD